MNRFVSASIALALLGASAAHAETAGDRSTAKVRYGDLKLDSRAGRAELDRRVQSAIRKVCRTEARATSRAEIDELRSCAASVRGQVDGAVSA